MVAEEELRARLLGSAGLAALVGTRVFGGRAAQNADLPHVVWKRISGSEEHALDGPSGVVRGRFAVDCYALTYEGTVAAAEQVSAALQVNSPTLELYLDGRQDFYEDDTPKRFRRSLDFTSLEVAGAFTPPAPPPPPAPAQGSGGALILPAAVAGGGQAITPTGPLVLSVPGGGPARAGQRVTVTNLTGWPCYVQVCLPGTESFDQPWLDLDLHQPEPSFELGYQHVGFKVRVRAMELDGAGLPTGAYSVSNEIGPVLHAVDPETLPGAEVVATQAQLRSAMDRAVPVIVLAPGTQWVGTDFRNTYAGGRITTTPDNPARIVNSFMSIGNWDNTVYDGLVHYMEADFLRSLTIWNDALTFGGGCANLVVRSLKIYSDNVPPSVYQAVPVRLDQSPYRNTNLSPPGTGGMTFLTFGLNLTNTVGARLEGFWARNVRRGLALAADTVADHMRVHGHYDDAIIIAGRDTDNSGVTPTNIYVTHNYGLYDERDATSNSFGAGNAPHSEIQVQGGLVRNLTFDFYVLLPGNTRAQGDGCTAAQNPVNPNFISSSAVHGFKMRRGLLGGSGAISFYCYERDYQLEFLTQAGMGLRAGGSSGAIRFNVGSQPGDEDEYDDEGMVSRSILTGPVITLGLDTSAFITRDEIIEDAGASIGEYIRGDLTVRCDTLAEFALRARPRPEHADKGALTPGGHWRTLGPIPNAPGLTLAAAAGGFTAALETVPGATLYRIRYRDSAQTGPWTVPSSATPSFAAGGFAAGVVIEVQTSARTPDGWSRWGAAQTVTAP